MTVALRILDDLRRAGRPLDDDELARRLGISPRQTINQAARRLERAGRLRRYTGHDGKIVNDLELSNSSPPGHGGSRAVAVVDSGSPEQLVGNTREQREAEGVMLRLLGERLGLTLRPRRISLPDGIRVELDGADEELSVLVEAWAHQGPPKVAQKHKVLADAFKLLYVASTLPTPPRLVLCLSDHAAARHFTDARSWAAQALRSFGMQVEVVDLPADLRTSITAAQERQRHN